MDLSFDQVLLDLRPFKCGLNIDCEIVSQEISTDAYKEKSYDFQNVKTFLGFSKISPAIISDIDQFNYLRVFNIRNTNLENKKTGKKTLQLITKYSV